LSDCANGSPVVGNELFGTRPPNADSAKRIRKAATAVMSITHKEYMGREPSVPAKGVLTRIVMSYH
jgi:hypothetical protein